MLAPCVKRRNNRIGKALPSVPGMAGWKARRDGERGVEKKHPILRPTREVASALVNFAAVFGLQLLVYVHQRWRRGRRRQNGKTKPMCLIGTMVRVLTNDYHLDLPERSAVKSLEYEAPRRVAHTAAVCLSHECGQRGEIRTGEFVSQDFLPRWLYLYVHIASCSKPDAWWPGAGSNR